jgi:hypothetical protein
MRQSKRQRGGWAGHGAGKNEVASRPSPHCPVPKTAGTVNHMVPDSGPVRSHSARDFARVPLAVERIAKKLWHGWR